MDSLASIKAVPTIAYSRTFSLAALPESANVRSYLCLALVKERADKPVVEVEDFIGERRRRIDHDRNQHGVSALRFVFRELVDGGLRAFAREPQQAVLVHVTPYVGRQLQCTDSLQPLDVTEHAARARRAGRLSQPGQRADRPVVAYVEQGIQCLALFIGKRCCQELEDLPLRPRGYFRAQSLDDGDRGKDNMAPAQLLNYRLRKRHALSGLQRCRQEPIGDRAIDRSIERRELSVAMTATARTRHSLELLNQRPMSRRHVSAHIDEMIGEHGPLAENPQDLADWSNSNMRPRKRRRGHRSGYVRHDDAMCFRDDYASRASCLVTPYPKLGLRPGALGDWRRIIMSMISRETVCRECAACGAMTDAISGVAVIVLAVCGLADIQAPIMAATATIVFGMALFIQTGAALSEYSQIIPVSRVKPIPFNGLSRGSLAVVLLVGAAGIILGVLALLDINSAVLTPIATIAFGAALVLRSTSDWAIFTPASVREIRRSISIR